MYLREPQLVESGIDGGREWTLEGESKGRTVNISDM
jgi:hypothetical protein